MLHHCTSKTSIAETASSMAERGLVKVALCTALTALPFCILSVEGIFVQFIVYDTEEAALLVQNSTALLTIAHPYILFFVGSKVREHFANDWFFWK
jgi:hypothetical protein